MECGDSFSRLYLSIRARGVVDESVLEQGEEDEGDAHVGPHVYRLGGNITPSSTLDKGSKENIYTDTPYQTI